MTATRRAIFALAAVGLAALFCAGFLGLNPYGHASGVYATTLNAVAVAERHATDVVAAVNFDYRGFDTMGEEFILFASTLGVGLLLRRQPDEREERSSDAGTSKREAPPTSGAVRVLGVALVPLTVVFGAYVVAHGVPTPGGGFQGGVILATAPLAVYLASEARTFMAIAPQSVVEACEAIGAGAYVIVGALGLLRGLELLSNVVPLGVPSKVFSGGTIFVLNVGVGLEVAAGFVVLLFAFVEETLEERMGAER